MESKTPPLTHPLAGFERLFSAPGAAFIITDCFHLDIDSKAKQALLQLGHAALHQVCLKHPKMRARVVEPPSGPAERYYEIAHDISPEALKSMFRVTVPTADEGPRHWEQVASVRQNTPLDRSAVESLWSIDLVLAAPQEDPRVAHLIVECDHCVGDGFSTSRVAHDFLDAVSMLSQSKTEINSEPDGKKLHTGDALFTQLPLMLPMRELVNGSKTGSMLTRACLPLISRMAVSQQIDTLRKHPPVLQLDPSMAGLGQTPPQNATFNLFAEGDKAAFAATRRRCKEESVTFHGPLVASIVTAFCQLACKKGVPSCCSIGQDKIQLLMDIDWNLRKRVSPSLGDDHVATNICFGTLQFLQPGAGVSPSAKFWDVARKAKAGTEELMESFEARVVHDVIGNVFKTYEGLRKLFGDLPGATLGDVNLSNIGPYPFPTTHQVGGDASIRIKSHHLVNSNNLLGQTLTFYASAVDGLPAYALAYRSQQEATANLFTDLVAVLEGIGTIGPNESIKEVALRLCPSMRSGEVSAAATDLPSKAGRVAEE